MVPFNSVSCEIGPQRWQVIRTQRQVNANAQDSRLRLYCHQVCAHPAHETTLKNHSQLNDGHYYKV